MLLTGDLAFLFGVWPLELGSIIFILLDVIDAVLPLTDGKFSLSGASLLAFYLGDMRVSHV